MEPAREPLKTLALGDRRLGSVSRPGGLRLSVILCAWHGDALGEHLQVSW